MHLLIVLVSQLFLEELDHYNASLLLSSVQLAISLTEILLIILLGTTEELTPYFAMEVSCH